MKSDKNSPESKPKTHPFLDSVPLTIWICKIRRSTPPGPLSPPRSSTSLPSVASMTEHDLRKTISAPKIASPDREEVPNDEQCERSGRNKSLLDFYRKSVETSWSCMNKLCKCLSVTSFFVYCSGSSPAQTPKRSARSCLPVRHNTIREG